MGLKVFLGFINKLPGEKESVSISLLLFRVKPAQSVSQSMFWSKRSSVSSRGGALLGIFNEL